MGDDINNQGTPVEPDDLTAAVRALRQDNDRLAGEVELVRRRCGWILLLAALLLLFGSCGAGADSDVSSIRTEVTSISRQLSGDSASDVTPGGDVRSTLLEQCTMLGRIGRGLKVSPVPAAPTDGESACAQAARTAFTAAP